jgi:hypothetical protein
MWNGISIVKNHENHEKLKFIKKEYWKKFNAFYN